jgi:hypothetical protein
MPTHRRTPAQVSKLLADLGTDQLGLVSARDVIKASAYRSSLQNRVDAESWIRTDRGIYLPRLAPDLSVDQQILSAALAVPGSVIAGWSAARIKGLEVPESAGLDPVELAVPREHRSRKTGVVAFRGELPSTPWNTVRVATPALLIVGLAATGTPSRRLERLLDDCLAKRITTVTKISDLLTTGGWTRFSGRRALRTMLADRSDGRPTFRSRLEQQPDAWLAASGLPASQPNHLVETSIGVLELDRAWPRQRINLEFSPWGTHGSRQAQRRDADRRNALQACGWRVIEADDRQLGSAAAFALIVETLRPLLS